MLVFQGQRESHKDGVAERWCRKNERAMGTSGMLRCTPQTPTHDMHQQLGHELVWKRSQQLSHISEPWSQANKSTQDATHSAKPTNNVHVDMSSFEEPWRSPRRMSSVDMSAGSSRSAGS